MNNRFLLSLIVALSSACVHEVASPGEIAGEGAPGGKADGFLDGAQAEAIYDAMQLEGMHDGAYTTSKEATGELVCTSRVAGGPGGGFIGGGPPSYRCRMDGVLDVTGAPARALFEALDGGEHDGGYTTTKRAEGTLRAAQTAPWGGSRSYSVSFITPKLEIDGDLAETVYEAMNVDSDFDGAYFHNKSLYGELVCSLITPWEGPASYRCFLGEELSLEDSDAEALYEALKVESEFDGAYSHDKRASGELKCSLITPWDGPSSYRCSM